VSLTPTYLRHRRTDVLAQRAAARAPLCGGSTRLAELRQSRRYLHRPTARAAIHRHLYSPTPSQSAITYYCVVTNTPVVVIYQNADYVEGILQELLEMGLIEWEEDEQSYKLTADKKSAAGAGADAAATADLPVLAGLKGGLFGKLNRENSKGQEDYSISKRRFVYSQTFYLQIVKAVLRHRRLISDVKSLEDAKLLKSGEFVEFNASFRANEVTALLDIATPDLVSEIARFITRREGQRIINGLSDHESITAAWQQSETLATTRSDFARAIATAARVDFRSGDTSEYLGTVGGAADGVTAVTICDSVHFTCDDHDRVLDGEFTVLGKVTSKVEYEVPVLDRNKVLNRISAEFLEEALEKLQDSATVENTLDRYSKDALNVEFHAKIPGGSFKVLPVAIYA